MRSNTNKQKKTTVEQNVTYIVVEKVIKTGEFYKKLYIYIKIYIFYIFYIYIVIFTHNLGNWLIVTAEI